MNNVKSGNSISFGFVRVSKNDQSLDALKLEGCDEIVIEKNHERKSKSNSMSFFKEQELVTDRR